MRTNAVILDSTGMKAKVGMKPLSERDENPIAKVGRTDCGLSVGMKPLSERDENRFIDYNIFRIEFHK